MDYVKLSKTISYILRHHPEDYNLELDSNGFVDVNLLLDSINANKWNAASDSALVLLDKNDECIIESI